MSAEGWYRDPFEQHEQRWFSAGTPTDLVRDADLEAYAVPPRATWDGPLVDSTPEPTDGDAAGNDLLRADDTSRTTRPYDPRAASDAALDSGATGGLGFG